MADLEIGALRTFVSIIDSGGFGRAGEKLHRSQSTISQQIRKLEDRLGQPLMVRNARRMALTEEGERLLGHARRMLDLHDEALALFRQRRPQVLRLGVTEDWAAHALPGWLAQLHARHPQLQLQVCCDLSVTLEAAFRRGELDLVLYKKLGPVEPSAGGIWRQPLHWIGNAEMARAPLQTVPLVAFNQGCVYRKYAVDVLDGTGRPWYIAYASPNLMGVTAALEAGLGVGVMAAERLPAGLRRVARQAGLPPLPHSQLVLDVRPDLGEAGQQAMALLAQRLDETVGAAAGTR